ncbi:MAG: hypothetical protein ACTHK2_12920 [Dokdonella sp.]|uniref:hypothetical protein n=1 Tax=Dokdonella sp. TaxID=2291710 RepID=UPI003F7F4613
MKGLAWVAAIALATGSFAAHASTTIGGPSVGLWAHPGDGGRGFNIDIQGDTMIVTTFIYTGSGDPIWYLSSGFYNHDTGRFTSTYDSYSNGQCFGCPAQQPVVHSAAAGPISIQFHDNQSATLTTPAGSLEIVKFNYGFPSLTGMLYGEWVFSLNAGGLVDGDWIVFDHPYTGSDGTVYAAGHSDDGFSRVALGTYSASAHRYIVVASQSGNYVHSYVLGMDDRRGLGSAWVHLSSNEPTGDGSLATAARVLYEGELIPLGSNRAVNPAAANRDQHDLVAIDKRALDPALAAEFDKLGAALREYAGSRR